MPLNRTTVGIDRSHSKVVPSRDTPVVARKSDNSDIVKEILWKGRYHQAGKHPLFFAAPPV
jgi:hypothetical protein